ncbi:DUF7504 family protein [Halomontanus rarus]|uniref:DUF7504 family protein n=1 Tax=Halomontanus rarus TaxID=3034020 RepID=UPI0023E81AEB|nr:hypothetical protein [Halovivax sp. TS33]
MVGNQWADSDRDPKPGSNVLVLTPSDELHPEACIDRLVHPLAGSETESVVIVSDDCSTTEIIETWHNYGFQLPKNSAIVSRGGTVQRPVTVDVDGVCRTTVTRADLSGLTRTVNTYLTRWRDDPLSTLWFDSITALLRTTDLETTYRLCHVLTTKVRHTDAIGYYRLDPSVHNARAVATLTPLFDLVLE